MTLHCFADVLDAARLQPEPQRLLMVFAAAELPRDATDILFLAALGGRGGFAPNSDEAVQPLKMMVEAIKGGRIADFLAVNRDGTLVQLVTT